MAVDPNRTNSILTLAGLGLLALGLVNVFTPDEPTKSTVVETAGPTIVTESPKPGESPQPKTTTTEPGLKTVVTTPSSSSRRTDTTIAWLLGAGAIMALTGQFYGRIQSITLGPASLTLSGVEATAKSIESRLKSVEDSVTDLTTADRGLVALIQAEHARVSALEAKVDRLSPPSNPGGTDEQG